MTQPISRYNDFCTGYFAQTEDTYITAVKLAVAKVPRRFEHHGSKTLDSICAFDKAEAENAYIGQTNVTYVSSFCSTSSYLWGFNLAKTSKLFTRHRLLGDEYLESNNRKIEVYSAESLTSAFVQLVGTRLNRIFPFYPGTHLPAAGRSIELAGPTNLYAAIGVGITNEENSAHTFMEDIGEIPLIIEGDRVEEYKSKILGDIARSIVIIGEEQGLVFKYIFVDIVSIEVNDDEVGAGLVIVPYFNIASGALPNGSFEALKNISLEEWSKGGGRRK